MKELLVILAIFALLMVLKPALQFVLVFFSMLRWPIWSPIIARLPVMPDLEPVQRAVKAEVESLGFTQVASFTMQSGPETAPQLFFRHESGQAFAWLNMTPSQYSGYPIAFYSFLQDGRELLTQNRIAWAMVCHLPEHILCADPMVDSVKAHWVVHQARMNNAPLLAPSDDEAIVRIQDMTTKILPAGVKQGVLMEHDDGFCFTITGALQTAARWLMAHTKLATPFDTAATKDEFRAAYFASLHAYQQRLQARRHARQPVRTGLTIISMLLFFLLWWLAFDWLTALMLIGVIAVHEGGHAIAMWCFGHRDLQVFFVPFLGAVVTSPERPLAVWKRAIIYLAGPLPGLLFGLALLIWGIGSNGSQEASAWLNLEWMAIGVNLFNLLPVTPLDGGRLLEVSLLGNRPRLRFGFAVVSLLAFAGLALWTHDNTLCFLSVLLAVGLRSQWRSMRMQQTLARQTDANNANESQASAKAVRLYRDADAISGTKTFSTQWPLVKQAEAHRQSIRAQRWEMAGIPMLLLVIWLGSLWCIAQQGWPALSGSNAAASLPQAAFDTAYSALDEDLDDEDQSSIAQRRDELRKLAQALPPQDPRRIDFEWIEARAGTGEARLTRMQEIIALQLDGYHEHRKSMVWEFLEQVHISYLHDSALVRKTRLQKAVDDMARLAPNLYSASITGRLRIAQLIDQLEGPKGAETLIQSTLNEAKTRDDCKCQLQQIYEAYAWFMMSHARHAEAVDLLEHSPYTDHFKRALDPLGETRAWALLMNGQYEAGIAQMRIATYTEAYTPDPSARARGTQARPPMLIEPGALAFALLRGGREQEARSIMQEDAAVWACQRDPHYRDSWAPPWETLRDRWIAETLRPMCPPLSAQSAPQI